MSNDIELSPRILEIVNYYFTDPNQSYTALAKHFGISVQRISQIMTSKTVKAAYPILCKDQIDNALPKATHRYLKLMNQNVNLNVAEKVTSKILERGKVLEPPTSTIRHEIQLKSVKELQDIIEGSKSIPQQVFEAEIVSGEDESK